MNCKSCGSSKIKDTVIESQRVQECEVCGHLHGNAEVLNKITESKKAKEQGIDSTIYPLYALLQKIAGFKIEFTCPGYPQEKVPPYVSFSIAEGKSKSLEQLTQVLVQANKKTKVYWMVEVTFQKQLLYILKPNFHHDPYNISVEQISMAQKDIETLVKEIGDKIRL